MSEMQYSKFEFRDFSIGDASNQTIIPGPKKNESEAHIENIVNDAVIDALNENIGTPLQQNTVAEPENSHVEIDVEKIRAESYQNGYNDAKGHFEPLVNAKKEDDLLSETLKSKLDAILPVIDMQNEIFALASKTLACMAKKMHLAIPADFDRVVLGEMMSVLNKYYKTGEINIKVNPERVDYCKNLLKINTLPAHIAENIKIVSEDTLGKSDCIFSWGETKLEYSQEEIEKDTNVILEHLNIK